MNKINRENLKSYTGEWILRGKLYVVSHSALIYRFSTHFSSDTSSKGKRIQRAIVVQQSRLHVAQRLLKLSKVALNGCSLGDVTYTLQVRNIKRDNQNIKNQYVNINKNV